MAQDRADSTAWIDDEMTVLLGTASTLRRYWHRFSDDERREWMYVLSERTERLDHLVRRTVGHLFSVN